MEMEFDHDAPVQIEDLFTDCARREDAHGKLAEFETYEACWSALADLLDEAIEDSVMVSIPGFGVVSYRVYSLGISVPNFTVDREFAVRYKVLTRKPFTTGISGAQKKNPVDIDYARGAAMAGVDPGTYQAALSYVFRALGSHILEGFSAVIDFGGTLSGLWPAAGR